MDPVIATGIINLGSNIIHKAFSNPSESNNLHEVNFERSLHEVSDKKVLSASEIDGLRKDILASAGVKEFLNQNEGNLVSIDKLSDGSVRLLSSSGDFMTLRTDHPTSQLVSKYFDSSIAASTNLNPERPNSVILTG